MIRGAFIFAVGLAVGYGIGFGENENAVQALQEVRDFLKDIAENNKQDKRDEPEEIVINGSATETTNNETDDEVDNEGADVSER